MTNTTDDIRRLLRSFGMRADEAIQARIKDAGGVEALKLRIVLEDVTDYGVSGAGRASRFLEIEGEIT